MVQGPELQPSEVHLKNCNFQVKPGAMIPVSLYFGEYHNCIFLSVEGQLLAWKQLFGLHSEQVENVRGVLMWVWERGPVGRRYQVNKSSRYGGVGWWAKSWWEEGGRPSGQVVNNTFPQSYQLVLSTLQQGCPQVLELDCPPERVTANFRWPG